MKYLIIVVMAILSFSCDTGEDSVSTERALEGLVYAELIEQHGATVRWIDLFLADDSSAPQWSNIFFGEGIPYSFEVSEALEGLGEQPILFSTFLTDIVRDDSGYTARFSCHDYFMFMADLSDTGAYYGFLSLRCSEEQVDYLTEVSERSWMDEFAIIATISDFGRPRFSIHNEAYTEANEALSELYIKVDNAFEVLYGNLIDARRL